MIKTRDSTNPNGPFVDVSTSSGNWNKAYEDAHRHHYNKEFSLEPNGVRARFFFTTDNLLIEPKRVVVYKNGLRMRPMSSAGQSIDTYDYKTEFLDSASAWVEFVYPPNAGDVLLYDYEEKIV
jgi:hypothetical protein